MAELNPAILVRSNNFTLTDTFISMLITDLIIIALVLILHKQYKLIPGKLQTIAELGIDYFKDIAKGIAGNRADIIYPWAVAFFVFIFLSNIQGIIPGVGSVLYNGHAFIRPVTSDLNFTAAAAVISIFVTHILSIKYLGILGYLQKWFSFNPIMLFVGVLELFLELTKIISLAFRLFGNIYAGDTVLHMMSSFTGVNLLGSIIPALQTGIVSKILSYVNIFIPLPFMLLETIVAGVQGLVFAMLTLVFMSMLTGKTEH